MFRSYQTILRELSCLVVKLLRAADFLYFVGYVAACIWIRLCAPFVVDVPVARTRFLREPKHVGAAFYKFNWFLTI